MQRRRFGNTDLEVSEIGFGAWAIGGGIMVGDTAIGWGKTDDAVSEKAIYTALDKGINFFDTADIYGLGHSEELLGRLIGKEKDIILATKGGNVARHHQFTVDYTKEYLISACEASLKRLRRDCIDYYQLHTARLSHLQESACTEAMQQLQKQGKIRYWGLSLNTFYPEPEANYMAAASLGHGFQLVLNIINQRALPLLQHGKEYGIIARMPLQFGLLTGKFDEASSFDTNDHRQKRLTPAIIQAARQALEPVWALCQKYDCSKTGLALRYTLSYPAVSVVIPGMRTPEQVMRNTQDSFLLEPADLQMIEACGRESFANLMEAIEKAG